MVSQDLPSDRGSFRLDRSGHKLHVCGSGNAAETVAGHHCYDPLAHFRFDHKGWYDRKSLAFQEIVDVGMVAAMGPPGGGRNEISARLLRHYCILAFDELQRTSVATIFRTLNQHCFQNFSEDIKVF